MPDRIEQMRLDQHEGLTLEEIGAKHGGISRQRVFQLLKRKYQTTDVGFRTRAAVCKELRIQHDLLKNIDKGLGIGRWKGVHYVYTAREVSRIRRWVARNRCCPHCGGEKSLAARQCATCGQKNKNRRRRGAVPAVVNNGMKRGAPEFTRGS